MATASRTHRGDGNRERAAYLFPRRPAPSTRNFSESMLGDADMVLHARAATRGEPQIRSIFSMIRVRLPTAIDDVNFTPPYLATITADTLIVFGDRDPLYPSLAGVRPASGRSRGRTCGSCQTAATAGVSDRRRRNSRHGVGFPGGRVAEPAGVEGYRGTTKTQRSRRDRERVDLLRALVSFVSSRSRLAFRSIVTLFTSGGLRHRVDDSCSRYWR